MFWKFGLGATSAIDGLLEKEDRTLEELLDEDDLLQECKAHNQKLIEYLRGPNVLSQLFNYITRDDLDDKQNFKYPYIACEVLCCEIWEICEAIMENIDLLASFWQLLDRPPPLNQLQASYFMKVNAILLQRKTSEMVKFIESIPGVVHSMLSHMETSAIMDLLLKLISMEEYTEGAGIVDWLDSEGLIESLVSKLDPNFDSETHSTTAQVLIDIITLSQSTNPEQGGIGPNALSQKLISEPTVSKLVDYMLDPEAPNSTSTLTNGVSIFLQIIQKNNCDYEERSPSLAPHQPQPFPVVDLSDMLRVFANRIGEFKALLEKPKSVTAEIETTIGKMIPLGSERFRICELFAELLHCSNMHPLNAGRNKLPRTNGYYELKHMEDYNDYGQAAMSFISADQLVQPTPYIIQTQETGNTADETAKPDSIESNDVKEEKPQNGDTIPIPSTENTSTHQIQEQVGLDAVIVEENEVKDVLSPMEIVEQEQKENTDGMKSLIIENADDPASNGSIDDVGKLPVGDILKAKFIEHRIIPTCLDLFFNFKWNNFLHTVVYDMIAQIFNGRMDVGYNKELAISVFRDGQLTKRITKAQRLNDYEVAQPKGVRLGYMGHLTFISEEVKKLIERHGIEIVDQIREYFEAEDWQEYVAKTLRETLERDRQPLGGQRPSNHDSLSPSREVSDDSETDEDDLIEPANGPVAHERFAIYLCQQITSELPDQISDDSEDSDDEAWMGSDEGDIDIRAPYINPAMAEHIFKDRRSSLNSTPPHPNESNTTDIPKIVLNNNENEKNDLDDEKVDVKVENHVETEGEFTDFSSIEHKESQIEQFTVDGTKENGDDGYLDPKEYPLADTPTPPALKRFCFDLNGQPTYFREDEESEQAIVKLQEALYKMRATGPTTASNSQTFHTTPTKPRARQSSSQDIDNELASDDSWQDLATEFRRNSQSSSASNSGAMSPTNAQFDSTSPLIQPTPMSSSSRHFTSITTSNLGMDTPSTTRSTHSSALPSPSLSPVTGMSASGNNNQFDSLFAQAVPNEVDVEDTQDSTDSKTPWHLTKPSIPHVPSLLDLPTMLATFDALPGTMQSYMLFHLLRRCPANTLQYVSNIILPALRKDFLGLLPLELSLHIVRYLDARSMCQAAIVSKRWRSVIDGDGFTWKRRLEADGYVLEEGEEERCIREGWSVLSPIRSINYRGKEVDRANQQMQLESTIGTENENNLFATKLDDTSVPMERYTSNNETELMNVDLDNTMQENSTFDSMFESIRPSNSFSSTASATLSHKGKEKSAEDENDDSDDIMSQSSMSAFPASTERPHSISLDAASKLPLEPSARHPYKAIYRRHHLIRQNWRHGRYKHISFPGHGNNVVTCLQFDTEKIISGSDDQCINVYETATGKLINRLEGHDGGVWALQYVGNTLVSGSTDRTVRVWDIKRGVCTHIFPGHTSTVRCLQIIMPQATSDSTMVEPPIPLIVTGSRDSTLRVWRLPDTTNDTPFAPSNPSSPSDNMSLQDNPYFIRTLQGHTHSVRALAGVGNTLVSGSYDCSVRVWNIMTGECLWRLTAHTQKVYSVVLDAKRNRCMSGSMDGTVKVWSLEDGTCVWSLEGHSSLVGLLDLSHDYLVSAAADSTLRIWNPNDGTCKHVLTAHTGAITCFQHDEHKVISGSDGTLKMWDVKTGKFVRDLLTGLSGVWQVRFGERRCVAAVQRNQVTFFEVLDFGVYNVEEDNNITGENGEWIPRRTTVGVNDGDASS
ncbi:1665_t:CDS:10 [Paraglomus occultum]|uniref:1665_t:CDS:1 n=1 Tax=Paraglomus occultum TaxID=144539 RepID=A0A9N8Z4T8_9GLOM|nr:1665_t:CDS:10 [Paraglomus occultum]